jgi:hypothetical protein
MTPSIRHFTHAVWEHSICSLPSAGRLPGHGLVWSQLPLLSYLSCLLPQALGRLRGSITAESFAKVALKHRLLGSLPTAAGGVEVSRLAKAVELFSTLIRLFVSDIRREGCQVGAWDTSQYFTGCSFP